ncbi:MAG: hypothetical protein HYZ21_04435 [Chloroflexi bacterium]|nr:hypothetical protein [Chloroflexota bacterium]
MSCSVRTINVRYASRRLRARSTDSANNRSICIRRTISANNCSGCNRSVGSPCGDDATNGRFG